MGTEARLGGLVAKGRTNQEIAEAIALRPDSVESHLLRACEKLGVRSRAELAVMLTVSNGPIGSSRNRGRDT